MEWKHESLEYRISDQKELLQVDTICTFLKSTYWAAERTKGMIAKSIEGSLCFGLYDDSEQVGFMRVVTDYATFSWICDVFIHPEHRGRELGKWIMQFLVEHPALSSTNMLLGTRDAHGLYVQFGFERIVPTVDMMRRAAKPSATS